MCVDFVLCVVMCGVLSQEAPLAMLTDHQKKQKYSHIIHVIQTKQNKTKDDRGDDEEAAG